MVRRAGHRVAAALLSLVLAASFSLSSLPRALAADDPHVLAVQATTYYVSTSGSDTNSGTSASPFKTISHAASVMGPGDTCHVAAGTYRETLSDSAHALDGTQANPISFVADGDVTISGGDVVTNWTSYSGSVAGGNVWQATAADNPSLSTNIHVYNQKVNGTNRTVIAGNLVFVDGKATVEGRWPNLDFTTAGTPGTATAGDLSALMDRDSYELVGEGSLDGLIKDPKLFSTDASGIPASTNLVGSWFWCPAGVAYWSYFAEVTSQDTANHAIQTDLDTYHSAYDYPWYGNKNVNAAESNIYYLSHSLALVDVPYEWYKDPTSNTLYLCLPASDNPSSHSIEARAREYAINLTQSSYVTFTGFNVRGALVSFDGTTNHCTFTQAKLETLDANQVASKATIYPGGRGLAKGMVLGGDHNTISRCELKNMYGEAVTVQGTDNSVVNNSIHDVCFEVGYLANAIQLSGRRHLIARNTVTRAGHSIIGGSKFEACELCYNDISDANRITRDSGVLYFNAHDFQGTTIHHNVIHDSTNNQAFQVGLYFDSFTTGMVAHHNLIYGIENDDTGAYNNRLAFFINPNSLNNVVVNNTVVNIRPMSCHHCDEEPPADFSGTIIANNLFYSQVFANNSAHMTNHGFAFLNNVTGTYRVFSGVPEFTFADGTYLKYGQALDESGKHALWTDASNHDYTLAAGSPAIDAGIVYPGITTDVTDGKPDAGCFEYGKTPWTTAVGCNLSANVTATYSLSKGTIPGTNLLANPDLESYTSSETLENWTTAGSTERIRGYSWGTWGGIAKGGSYFMRLAAGGTMTQTVTGLKPNTTYEVGGYAHVDGTYVQGNRPHGPDLSVGDKRELVYTDVDFGSSGSDRMLLYFKSLNLAAIGSKVELLLDNSTTPTGSVTFTEMVARPDIPWDWLQINFGSKITGTHKVTLRLVDAEGTTAFSNTTFGGFFLDASDAADTVSISATPAGGTKKSVTYSGRTYSDGALRTSVTTGSTGSITVEVSKSAGSLYGYVDELFLRERVGEASGVTFADKAVYDTVVAQVEALGLEHTRHDSTKTLDIEPYLLVSVTTLDLGGKGVSDLGGIERMTGLESLDLSNNGLTGLHGLEDLGNLRELDISHNQLTGVPELSELSDLTVLKASHNKIADVSVIAGSLKKLTWLDLSNNLLADYDTGGAGTDYARCKSVVYQLREVSKLEHLDLSCNNLRYVHGAYYMSQLKELDLHSNNIRDLTYLNAIYGWYGTGLRDHLEFLDLSDNNRAGTGYPAVFESLSAIADMTSLKEFRFTDNNLPAIADQVKGLAGLEALRLAGNGISDAEVSAIRTALTGLEEFDLAPIKHTVSLGSISHGTAVLSATSVAAGETVSVTAYPMSGYELDAISYTPEGGLANDITATKQFVMPAKNVTVNVTFKALVPVTAETPDTAVSPVSPVTAESPATPWTPESPVTQDAPTTPETSDLPETAFTPGVPDEPGVPAGAQPGWGCDRSGTWRYVALSPEGAPSYVTGWMWDAGDWYLFDARGAMLSGWAWDAGWYHLHSEHDGRFGAMDDGWLAEAGQWYYLNPDPWAGPRGLMRTGWSFDGLAWYYHLPDGRMLRSSLTPDGCLVGPDGRWVP